MESPQIEKADFKADVDSKADPEADADADADADLKADADADLVRRTRTFLVEADAEKSPRTQKG